MTHFPDKFLNEQSYKDLFDNAHDLIHMVDLEGNLLYVNNAWTNLLEYSLAEILGHPIYNFIHPEDRNAFILYRTDVINGTKKDEYIITRFSTKTGKSITVEGFVTVRHELGKPSYTRGIFRDISEKIANNLLLKERERNLEQLLLHAPDAIIVINKESIISFWNPQAEKMFGWQSEEVIGRPLASTIIPQEYREAHAKGMKRFLSTGEARVLNQTIEITALNKRGEILHVSLTISSTLQNGEIAFIAFIRDITEKIKSAKELERKQKLLEQSNEQLEQFAHVASHDMKEPIRKIRFFSQLLLQDTGTSINKTTEYLTKINTAAERLQNMVEGVLNYSSASSVENIWEPVDLNKILKDIESDLELIITEKQARINYKNLPLLHGNSFLIYQLFYNLLNNSLKFSKKDEAVVIDITFKLVKGEDDSENNRKEFQNDFIEIKIKDNGIGFDQSHATSIFKTFTRLHSRSQFDGTGLGLSLCKTIMDRHNGSITAEGKLNSGSVFTLLFPVKKDS